MHARPRYSFGSLAIFVLFVAVACAALVNASPLWASAMFACTLAALAVSTLAAIVWEDSQRAGAAGFAVFGWIYFAQVFMDVLNTWYLFSLTEAALEWLSSLLYEVPKGAEMAPYWAIGYCVWTLLLGGMGFIAGHLLYAMRRDRLTVSNRPASPNHLDVIGPTEDRKDPKVLARRDGGNVAREGGRTSSPE